MLICGGGRQCRYSSVVFLCIHYMQVYALCMQWGDSVDLQQLACALHTVML